MSRFNEGAGLKLNFLRHRRQAVGRCSTAAASDVSETPGVPGTSHRTPPEGLQWVMPAHGKTNHQSEKWLVLPD